MLMESVFALTVVAAASKILRMAICSDNQTTIEENQATGTQMITKGDITDNPRSNKTSDEAV